MFAQGLKRTCGRTCGVARAELVDERAPVVGGLHPGERPVRRLPKSTRHEIRRARHRRQMRLRCRDPRTVSVMMTTSPALASTCFMYSLKRSPCLSEVGHRKSVRSNGRPSESATGTARADRCCTHYSCASPAQLLTHRELWLQRKGKPGPAK